MLPAVAFCELKLEIFAMITTMRIPKLVQDEYEAEITRTGMAIFVASLDPAAAASDCLNCRRKAWNFSGFYQPAGCQWPYRLFDFGYEWDWNLPIENPQSCYAEMDGEYSQ